MPHQFILFKFPMYMFKQKSIGLNAIFSLLLFSGSSRKLFSHLIRLNLHKEGNEEQTMHQSIRQLRVKFAIPSRNFSEKKTLSYFQGFLNKLFGLLLLPLHFVVILHAGNLIWSCTKAVTE